jgi:hypothetical protein
MDILQPTKLQVFDFDDTLFRIPTFSAIDSVNARIEYENQPYKFYDAEVSLNHRKYNIQLIEPVYTKYLEGAQDPNCMQILITHRVERLREKINFILERSNIKMSKIFILGRVSNKSEIVNNMLDQIKSINKIEIFEDSIDQIVKYQKEIKFNNRAQLDIWIVDKSKMFKLETFMLVSNQQRITLKSI